MDVSPKILREVEFRDKMRGYHPEDVDQFLEQVAAGVEVLQERLRLALERAQKAEAQVSEGVGSDDAIRRTLVLAQRTADLAVEEAREQAARMLAGAEQQAQAMIADAEDSARSAHEDSLVEVRARLVTLEATREHLQAEVEALTAWVEEHKGRLVSALRDAVARIEQTELLSPVPVSPVDVASPQPAGIGSESAAIPGPDDGEIPEAGDTSPEAPDSGAPGTEAIDVGAAGSAAGPGNSTPQPGGEDDDAGSGPPTMAWQSGEDEQGDNGAQRDPYLAELRRAVNDPHPPGPRSDEDDPSAGVVAGASGAGDEFFDQDLADVRRFGGRLRRRR
jgi:cell division initiation protein